MINDLLLLSGNDIPFEQAKLIIHQPTIKEIAYIGEESFYTGCEFLRFSKDKLNEEDRIHLEGYTNFEIIMSIIKEQNVTMQKTKVCVLMLFSLMFPECTISFEKDCILLVHNTTEEKFKIDKSNYNEFLQIINEMFCLKGKEGEESFNPVGEMSKKIANKLQKRHQTLAEKEGPIKVAILSRYVSILAVGQKKDINSLLNYTVYQLFDEFRRYELKIDYDMYIKAQLAGAKDLKEVDNWMMDIHS